MLIQTKYESLQNLKDESYDKKFNSLKQTLEKRVEHGLSFLQEIVEDIPDDYGVIERVPKIYNDMAKWTRLILKNEDKAKEYESLLNEYETVFNDYPKVRIHSRYFND